MSACMAIGKLVLASALSLAGFEEPNKSLDCLSEKSAEAIVSSLLSPASRERFQQMIVDAKPKAIVSVCSLDQEKMDAIEDFAEEAGSVIVSSTPLF